MEISRRDRRQSCLFYMVVSENGSYIYIYIIFTHIGFYLPNGNVSIGKMRMHWICFSPKTYTGILTFGCAICFFFGGEVH